jgi:hypothetical protein
MRKFSLLLAFAALLAFPHAILAQRSTATIRGTVADATRSSLPGALVTAKNDATGLTRTATTNDAGLYSIAEPSFRSVSTRSRSSLPASRRQSARG